jgi:ribosome-associated protein
MEESPSKSQKKRDADALQKVGVELIALSNEKLDKLSLTPNLRQAIMAAKTIKSHGAMRRQAQLIGKLMRSADSDTIVAEFQEITAESSAQTAAFHDLEIWRERLINGGKEALTEFIAAYGMVDVQQLRQLIKKAVDEKNNGQSIGAHKALFRFLRSYL